MNRCRSLLAIFFAVLFPLFSSAATTELRVLFDVDDDIASGCVVSAVPGVDVVLATEVTDSETSARVTRTHRQSCMGGVLGTPADVNTSGWPASWQRSSGNMLVETRVPFSALGAGGMPSSSMRVAFTGTRGADSFVVKTQPNGDDVMLPPNAARKRRSVGRPGDPRVITMDGQDSDWTGIPALTQRPADDGSSDIKLISVFVYANRVDSFLYFDFNLDVSGFGIVAVPDSYERTQGQATLTQPAPGVLGNDQPSNVPLTAALVSTPSAGELTLNPDGSFIYTPDDPSSIVTDAFFYKAIHDSDESNATEVTIGVLTVNDPPAVVETTFSVDENSGSGTVVGTVTVNDGDSGDTHTFAIVSGNDSGAFAINAATGQITVANGAALDFETDAQSLLVVEVTDSGTPQFSDTGEITINVNDANDAPLAAGDTSTMAEDGTISAAAPGVLGNDTDQDGNGLTAVLITGPAHAQPGFALNANGSYNYQPLANFNGTDSFTYQASDGTANSNTATVTITVTAVNDPPSFVASGAQTVSEDAGAQTVANWATSISAGPAGESGQTVTFVIDSNTNAALFAAGGQPAVASNGTLTYTPAANANGSATITLHAVDNGGGANASGTQTFTITVNAVNDPPAFALGGNVTVNEDAGLQSVASFASSIVVGPGDESGQIITSFNTTNDNNALFTGGGQPAIAPNGTLTYTPAANATGTADVTVTATDSGGATSAPAQTFTITVNAVNDAPQNMVPAAQSTNEDVSLVFTVSGGNGIQVSDVDGATLQVTLTATNGTLTAGSGASISNNNTATVTLAGTVANLNASLDGLVFIPTLNYNGGAQLTVTTNDLGNSGSGGAQQDSDPIAITVLPVNDPPIVNAAAFSLDENSVNGIAVGTAGFTDADSGQTHAFAITAGNTGGAFAIHPTTGAITVASSAALDFETTPSFSLTLTVTDDSGAGNASGTNTISVNLNNLNEAPSASDATFGLNENSANGTAVGTVIATDADAGQTMTYGITAGNTGGAFAIGASSGAITVADAGDVNFEVTPTFSLTVTVTDNGTGNLTDTATITVNLNNLNEAPVVNAATFNVNENSANTTSLGMVTFTEPDTTGQTHTYAITAGNALGAFAIDSITGELTVADVSDMNFEVNPNFGLTVEVTDAGAPPPSLSGTATITINLTDVNDAPVVNDQNFSIDENSANASAVGTVVASDEDSGQTLSYAITAGNALGAFTIAPGTGVITVADTTDVDFEINPSFSLTVEVTDNGTCNLTDSATIGVTINDRNEAPAVTPPGAASNVTENSATGTLVTTAAANDPDSGQTVTFSITGGNTAGAFAIDATSGQITVANAAAVDFETNPTFTLTVTVTDNGTPIFTDTELFTINVTNVNEAPVVNAVTFPLPENSPNGTAVGTVSFTEPDGPGQTHVYSITAGNISGAFAIDSTTGAITVNDVTDVDFETNPTFSLTVEVLDNGVPALTGSATITINLSNANEPPLVNDQTFNVDENSPVGTVVGSVVFSDPDGPTDTFAITAGNTGGEFALNPTTGEITVAGALNFEGTASYLFTVSVTDDGTPLGSDTADITIVINNLNEAPVINAAGPFALAENSINGTKVGTPVTFTEPDTTGQTHTYAITGGNSGGAFAISGTGQISVATSGAVNFETNSSFSLTVEVTDVGAPAPNLSDTTTVVINLSDVNDAPVVNDQAFNVSENSANGTIVGTVVASDEEVPATQTLTYTITAGNTGSAFAINASNGQITVANPINYESLGSYTLSVEVKDNSAGTLTDTAFVTITALDVNEPPVASDATLNVNENVANGTVVGTVAATDPDGGQALSYVITSGNTGTAFAIGTGNGQITVANPINFEGTSVYNLVVTVTDNGAGTLSDTAAITINVNNLNEAPVVNTAGPFILAENSANGTNVGTPITFSEPDTTGQTHAYSITAGNTNGAFSIDNSAQISVANVTAVNYEASPFFTLTVTVTDAGLPNPPNQSGSTNVTINLTDVNEAPIYSDASRSVAENSANGTNVGLPVTAVDEDVPAQTLTYSIIGGNTGNVFAINSSTGQITVNGAINFEGPDDPYSLTVQVTDNGTPNLSDTAIVTITVTDVNEAPVLPDASRTINENSANGTNVGAVLPFTDPDTGQTHTFSITAGNSTGAFAINNSGQITVADVTDLNYEVTQQFSLTIQIQDSGTGNLTDTAQVTIDVNNVNEAPAASPDTYNNVIGNTQHRIDGGVAGSTAVAFHTSATNPLANDTDPDTLGPPSFNTITASVVSNSLTSAGGRASIEADGSITYNPPAGYTGNDSWTYNITDGTNNVTSTVNWVVTNMVWYVKNDDASSPFSGTSEHPFNTLAAAGAAVTIPTANAPNTIFVFKGDGTTAGQNAGITLDVDQNLIGEAVDLVINSVTLVTGNAANRPILHHAAGNGVSLSPAAATTNTIRGLTISGTTNAIDVTSSGSGALNLTISDVVVNGAGAEGIDVNHGSTGLATIAITGNTWNGSGTHTGNAIDVARTAGTMSLNISTNTNIESNGAGITVVGGAAASSTVTGFANNTISGDTVGAGVFMSNVTFDANSGTAGFQQVAAGNTVIGAAGAGNGVSGNGLHLATVSGNLSFADLDIFTNGGQGLTIAGSGQFTGAAGTLLTVSGSGSTISSTAAAVVAQDLSMVASFGSVSSSAATTGATFTNVVDSTTQASSFSATGGSISGATNGFAVDGGNATITYPGSIANVTDRTVLVQNRTADALGGSAVTFSGVISGAGTGVAVLTNHATSSVTFSGGLTLNTGTNAAFTATNGGTITVCDENPCGISGSNGLLVNQITTTTGTALNVANTTIGASDLEFRSISHNGGNNGIIVDNTGSSGGLQIKGTGSTGSGGTIQNTTGSDTNPLTTSPPGTGVVLRNTQKVSLKWLQLNGHQNYAISAFTVVDFKLENSIINGTNGTNVSTPFRDSSVRLDRVTGTVTIQNNEITGGYQHNLLLDNNAGTTNLNVLGNNIHHTSAAAGDDGFQLEAETSATIFANVSNNTFTAHGGDHFNLSLINNANVDLTFKNNDMQGGHAIGLGQGVFILGATYNGTFKYDISNNGTDADPFTGNRQGGAIVVNKGSGTGTFSGQVVNNVIGNAGITGSGSSEAFGIILGARGAGGSHTTKVDSNKVRQWFDRGIVVEAGEGGPSLTVTMTNNTVSDPADPGGSGNSLHGIHFDFGILAADNAQITVDVRSNLIANAGNEAAGGADFRMRAASSNDVFIAGYSGGNSSANAQAFIDSANPDGTTFTVTQAGSGTYNNGPASPLPAPTLPTLPPSP